MGSLLGTQFFLGIAVTQNIIHFSQKSPSFKENDLNLISSVPHQGNWYNEELFFPQNFFSVALDLTWLKVVLTNYAIATLFFTLFSFFLLLTRNSIRGVVHLSVHLFIQILFVYVWGGRDFRGSPLLERKRKQVTRGHNILADGWTGASNLHSHPMSPTHIHKRHLKWFTFSDICPWTD